jgi:hypothetical protein
VSVDEWGEYIAYGGEEIKVAKSYRIYNERGELVATGVEWEEIRRRPGMDEKQEIERARRSLDEKIKRIKEEVARKYGGKAVPSV